MSDIVERLRYWGKFFSLGMEAADEIEKLRAALKQAERERNHQHGRADRNAKLHAVEQKKREELKAENEKLREAICEWAASIYGYEGVLFLEGLKHEEFINSILDAERDRVEGGEKE